MIMSFDFARQEFNSALNFNKRHPTENYRQPYKNLETETIEKMVGGDNL